MNEEIHCISKKGKTAKNEWENDKMTTPIFFQLYALYIKQDSSASILYSPTCLNKDASVVLQVINI